MSKKEQVQSTPKFVKEILTKVAQRSDARIAKKAAAAKKTAAKKTSTKATKKTPAKKAIEKAPKISLGPAIALPHHRKGGGLSKSEIQREKKSTQQNGVIDRNRMHHDLEMASPGGSVFPGVKLAYFHDLDGSLSKAMAFYRVPVTSGRSVWIKAVTIRHPEEKSDKRMAKQVVLGRLYKRVESLYKHIAIHKQKLSTWTGWDYGVLTEADLKKIYYQRIDNTVAVENAREVLSYIRKYIGKSAYSQAIKFFKKTRPERGKRKSDELRTASLECLLKNLAD